MAQAKTKEELLEAAWKRWRDENFTWAGLVKRKWQGWVVCDDGFVREAIGGAIYGKIKPDTPTSTIGRDATLQDYWRADPASGRWRTDQEMGKDLVSTAGQPTYHRCHLPIVFADGTSTGKAQWAVDSLDHLVNSRLKAAVSTQPAPLNAENTRTDGRARFDGGVWLKGAAHPDGTDHLLWVTHDFAFFVGRTSFASATFGGGAWFFSSTFMDDVAFSGATFSADTRFGSATFGGDVRFTGATFGGGAKFGRTMFVGEARFRDAIFHSDAAFRNATFGGHAEFVHATFGGNAGFRDAKFRGDARFRAATFYGKAEFSSATIDGLARFGDAIFVGDAAFGGTMFGGDAWFGRATFGGDAGFGGGRFVKRSWFNDASFHSTAHFGKREFEGLTDFSRAQFFKVLDFRAAVFNKLASFEDIVWPDTALHWHSAFNQALFRGTLNISKAGFQKFAAFDGVTLERGIQIDETTEAAATRSFFTERDMAIAAAAKAEPRPGLWGRWRWLLGSFKQWQSERASAPRAVRHNIAFPTAPWLVAYDARLKELERGCRVLKLAMEKASNKSREQLLYRFELLARRAQRGLPLGEALVSDLYGAVSDYGASMVRPFVALGILIVLFAGAFWGLAALLDPLTPGDPLLAGAWEAQMWSALDFSWANMFKPLSALADGENLKDGSMMKLLLTEAGDGWAFGVRLIATVQSLFSIVLAFLFALAVRRRFQIS